LERSDNTRIGLTIGTEEKNVYNTQVYGVQGNSSLVDPPLKDGVTTTQMIKQLRPNHTTIKQNHFMHN